MAFYKSPLETDEEYILLLGIVSARWAMMEEALAYLLGETLSNFETGYDIYFCASSFRQRIELIKTTAASQLTDAASQVINDLANDVYDAFKARNKMIHTPYHMVGTDKNGELFSSPAFVVGPGESLKWLGRGRYDNPMRINKGSFTGHLERLDDLIAGVVEAMDLVKDHPQED